MLGDKLPTKIEVVAFSGYKANERDPYFIVNERKLDVRHITGDDEWLMIRVKNWKQGNDRG